MADQVTISTFLELRDNLSEGMKRAAAAVEAATGRASASRARADQRAVAESARTAERIARQEKRSADAAIRETHRANTQKQRIYNKELADSLRQLTRWDREQKRSADLAIREAKRVEAAKSKAAQKSIAEANRTATRIAREEKRAADMAVREANRALAAKIRADQKAANEAARILARIVREEKRTADAAIREAKRVEEAKRKALAQPSGGMGGDGGGGLLGTLIQADLITRGLTWSFDKAKQAVMGMFETAIHYGIEYEKVNTDISSALFTTKMAPSMEVGKAAASDLMKTMHDISLRLPGQAQDYYYVFAQALPAAISVGMHDMKKFSSFISEYTAVAVKRNVSAQRAATDMQMMLQGRARITTNMFQKLLPYMNMTHVEFNKLMKTDRAKGIELLVKAVAQAASGMKGVAADALTTFGELQTRLQDIAIVGERPLFQATKNAVIDINAWLELNTNSVNNLASAVSNVLGDAFQGIVLQVIDIANGLKDILGISSSVHEKRTLSNIAEELFEAKSTKFQGPLGTMMSPIYATIMRGRVSRLEKEYSAVSKHEAHLKEVEKTFDFMKKEVPDLVIQKHGDIRRIAEQLTPYYKRDVFDVEGRKASEVLAEYLEARGMEKMDISKVWMEMLKFGADRPLSLAHPDDPSGGLDKPVAAPKTRPEQTFDFRHSRFDIKQEFAEGFDPDRIAVAFASDLGRLGDMKLQASYGLAGGVR